MNAYVDYGDIKDDILLIILLADNNTRPPVIDACYKSYFDDTERIEYKALHNCAVNLRDLDESHLYSLVYLRDALNAMVSTNVDTCNMTSVHSCVLNYFEEKYYNGSSIFTKLLNIFRETC
jgi:hypothetical protein